MNAKRISGALMVSLLLHCIIMIIVSTFYPPQTNQLKDAVTVEMLSPIEHRLPLLARRVVPMDKPVLAVETVQMQPRITTHAAVRPATSVQPQTVLEYSNEVLKMDSAIGVTVPTSSVQPQSPPVRTREAAKSGAASREVEQVKVAVRKFTPSWRDTPIPIIGMWRDGKPSSAARGTSCRSRYTAGVPFWVRS